MAKIISQAMEQAGIRPSQRHRKVSDYVLEQLVGEGPGYQDWQAVHSQVSDSRRRVRLYLVRAGATAEDRKTLERAALREFQLLETLQHPGILRAYNFTEHELGPALIFEHDPLAIRLDHFLAQQQDKLSIDTRLDLVRQIAEVVRYAHDKKVVHRALSPQSILVTQAGHHVPVVGDRPRIKVFNWQVGYREPSSSTGASRIVSATSHVDRLVEDASTAYMAPEALTDDNLGEHLDVFSLGAIAYHIFSGVAAGGQRPGTEQQAPRDQGPPDQLRPQRGRRGPPVPDPVQHRIPRCRNRTGTVVDFLGELDDVENELTAPDHDYVEDPALAKAGELIPGGYKVVKPHRPGGLLDRPARRAGGQGIRAQGGQRPAAQRPAQGRGRRAPEAPPPAYHRVRR